ncbi:MAG: response regulator [Acidobacteriota bacterium]
MAQPDGSGFQEKPRVLILDDEPALRSVMARMLGRACDVEAPSGIESTVAALVAGARWDAIVCDVRMPVVTGPKLLGILRESRPDLADRVLFTTGADIDDAKVAALVAEGCRVLYKPFTMSALVDGVASLIASPSIAPEPRVMAYLST